MNKFPFNLAAALAGKPLVTRDGRRATDFSPNAERSEAERRDPGKLGYHAKIESYSNTFTCEGRWASGDNDEDLFMTTIEDSNYVPPPAATEVDATGRPVAQKPQKGVLISTLVEAEGIVNGARQGQYGNPEDSFQRIAHLWNAYLRGVNVLDQGSTGVTPQDVANLMILLKLGRQMHSHKRDNYVDIAGYAELANRMGGARS